MGFALLGGGGVEVPNAGDMQNGATHPSLGKRLFMEVRSDHDFVAPYDGNIVIGDRVLPAIGHRDKEGLERNFVEEVSYLSRCDHFSESVSPPGSARPGYRVFPFNVTKLGEDC